MNESEVIKFFNSQDWPIDFEDPVIMAKYKVAHYKDKVKTPPLGELLGKRNAEGNLAFWEDRLAELTK